MQVEYQSRINDEVHPPSFVPPVGVCLATMSFYPLYAGPPVRFQRYAPGLARRGVRMFVFTQAVTNGLITRDGSLAGGDESHSGSSSTHRANVPLFEVVDGLPVQRINLPDGWRHQPTYFSFLAGYCRQRRREIDVVQFLSLDFWAVPWLRQLRRLGIGSVFTHTLLGDLSPHPWKRNLQRLYWRLPFNLVDHVVVSSSVMRQQLEDLGVSAPIQVIPNGVDLQRFRPVAHEADKARLRQQLELNPAWDVILAIGPITPRKGVEVLVEAFASLCREYPNAYLVLVGPRHDLARDDLADFHHQLQQAITGANAQERVVFTGAVSNVQDYLRAADLLVFPSRREGMPNVVPEAMASGLPIIMTPFIGLPDEFGRPGIHYLLSNWQPEVLATQLRILLSDQGRRRELGQAARRWVEQNLDVERSLDAYVELYQRVRRNSNGENGYDSL